MNNVKADDNTPQENLWSFAYKDGSAPCIGVVRASSEAMAFRVAQHWCALKGYRLPAAIRPMIVADESILKQPLGASEAQPLPSPVGATTR